MLEAAEAASFTLYPPPTPGRGLQPRSSARGWELSEEKGAAGPPRPESAARQRRPRWARAPSGRAGPARRRGRPGAGCFPVASLIPFPRLCFMI